ncbi:MAG: SLATT domain-containing protein [Bacteroidetes bacterium]|nr:SLATT domain-containing protein [Bacteroidota bacterium]
MENSIKSEIAKSEIAFNETKNQINKQKTYYKKKSYRNRILNYWVKAIVSILSVAAPSLVAYQSNCNEKCWPLLTICLVAKTGASTTLQSIFNYAGKFALETLTYLDLDALASEAEFKKEEIDHLSELERYRLLSNLNDNLRKKLFKIISKHMKAELSILIKDNSQEEPDEISKNKKNQL